MPSLFSGSGTTLGITATTTAPTTNDAAGYAALTYVDAGCLESIGSFGGTATLTEFTCLNTGIVQKVKGSRNSGDLEITLALDDASPGYDALLAAYEYQGSGVYHFKIQYENAPNATGTGAIRYFSGHVSSFQENVADADSVVTATVTIGITTPIIRVDAVAGA